MIEFLEKFNRLAFETADLILHYFVFCLPFIFTVCLFGVVVIGGIACLIDWIKERKTIQITNNEELENYEKQNKT